MKYLDPKNELAIQKVFGQNPQLCKSLINCLLPQNGSFFANEVSILPNSDSFVYPVFRNPSLVVECTAVGGKRFLVLFQMMWTDGFLQSVLFDSDKAYIRYQNEIQMSEYTMPVFGIALVNDVFEYEKDQYYHLYSVVEEAHSRKVLEGLNLVFVELPKMGARLQEADTKQSRWLNYFHLVSEHTIELPASLAADEEVLEAINLCRLENWSEKELFEYNKYKSVVEIKKGISCEAEERGFRRGIEKGMELGLEKGFARGYQKGSVAAVRRLALKALQNGLSPQEVMLISELNQLTIDNLVNLVGEFGAMADKHLGDW